MHYGQGPVQSRDIAGRQSVPEAYLHQVLGALSRAGLVRSTRGPLGGHELVQDPAKITLWDIIMLLDGPDRRQNQDAIRADDPVHETWRELQDRIETYLSDITLERLVEEQNAKLPPVNYSI
jgi:Rrf2 family protein